MKYYTCLILSNSETRLLNIADIAKDNNFVVVKTRSVLEFIHAVGFYNPECILIDFDAFAGDDVVNVLLNSNKKYLKDAIIISEMGCDGYTCVNLGNLSNALNLKRASITEKKIIDFNDRQLSIASSTIRKKLIDLGFVPKYNGFHMLSEIVLLCSISRQNTNMHNFILPAVAHKFDTTVSNITQCVRKSIKLRDVSKFDYPYEHPTLKQTVRYISELVNDTLLEIMEK